MHMTTVIVVYSILTLAIISLILIKLKLRKHIFDLKILDKTISVSEFKVSSGSGFKTGRMLIFRESYELWNYNWHFIDNLIVVTNRYNQIIIPEKLRGYVVNNTFELRDGVILPNEFTKTHISEMHDTVIDLLKMKYPKTSEHRLSVNYKKSFN